MMTKIPRITPYSETYKTACFQAWYAANRPTYSEALLEIIPEDEYGRKPVVEVIRRWRNNDLWDVKADDLDAKAFAIAEDDLVNSKVLMLKEQAAKSRMVQRQAQEYLDENGFDSSSSAVQGLFRAMEMEQKTRGLSAKLLELGGLDDDGLMSRTQKLLQRFIDSGEDVKTIIDVDEVKEDAESEN